MSFRHPVVSLPSSTSEEHLRALAEVQNFGTTNLGYPGSGSWAYRILHEPALTTELAKSARASTSHGAHSVSFQPCSSSIWKTQDRIVKEEWAFPGGTWKFCAIFDGHLNSITVDHVSRHLPPVVKNSLGLHLQRSGGRICAPQIAQVLSQAVVSVDDTICSNFMKYLPQDFRKLNTMSDAEVDQLFRHSDVASHCSIGTGGTTVLFSLVYEQNLWVVNLGDSLAVLGQLKNGQWNGKLLNSIHDANDGSELERLRLGHPLEPEVVTNGRVLGFLEPTRAIGDIWLKLSPAYSSRIFPRLVRRWISPTSFREYSRLLKTPPYVSNRPDVYHRTIPRDTLSFLVLASDGLPSMDTYSHLSQTSKVNRWIQVVGRLLAPSNSSSGADSGNLALALLRDAIGGADVHRVSQCLTVEMDERWVDDTTVIVQPFYHR